MDYNKALSFSRRTTLTFSTGTAAVNSGRDTSFNLTGTARLNHEIGRTWTASAGYSRSVQFVDLLLVPVLYDSLDASIIGLLNRRVEVQAGARASIGTIAIGSQGSRGDFDTFQATGQRVVRVEPVHRSWGPRIRSIAIDSIDCVQLPLGVPRNIDRQSIRAQVSFWAPIMNRARR